MASLLPETLFEAGGQGPAPSKDYYQLQITRSQVSFRWWRISLRNDHRLNRPGVTKECYEDFLDDVNLHVQIALVFGSKILQYVINLCKGKYDFLERLSDPLLLRIISYLDLEDIARLSQTSHRFQKPVEAPPSLDPNHTVSNVLIGKMEMVLKRTKIGKATELDRGYIGEGCLRSYEGIERKGR
ncbi:F-box only protein 36 isoform X2 [Dromiciops gliroides]|uniref:F-box only protein 36 isoform X2 n=1 Tax=Dromiciops gliroides TaxID=33562 RepID=UPI001CC65F80|nr:F-box only protein 36 isoform X2 [Dromiciops gliroides]